MHFRAHRAVARAVDGISLEWRRGEILGVVGESGCGKSTLARALLGLVPPTAGAVSSDGAAVDGKAALRELRRHVQMIFQDPYQTLNPRQRVSRSWPSRCASRGWRAATTTRSVRRAMEDVGLDPERFLDRYPTSSPAVSASAWRSPPRWCSSRTG